MRLEQSQKYSQSQSLTEVTLLDFPLIKTSFKPPVRLSYRAVKQVWKQVG